MGKEGVGEGMGKVVPIGRHGMPNKVNWTAPTEITAMAHEVLHVQQCLQRLKSFFYKTCDESKMEGMKEKALMCYLLIGIIVWLLHTSGTMF